MSEKIAIEDIGVTGTELVNRVKISGGVSPVYLTEKGETAYIVMPAGEYEKMKRQIQILSVIVEGEKAIAEDDGFDIEDVMLEAEKIIESLNE